jgi:hypothetical protein
MKAKDYKKILVLIAELIEQLARDKPERPTPAAASAPKRPVGARAVPGMTSAPSKAGSSGRCGSISHAPPSPILR